MNILIINLHSALNFGDQAILTKTLDLIESNYPEAKISLMANHPQSWKDVFNIDVIPSFINYTNDKKVSTKFFKIVNLSVILLFDLLKLKISYPAKITTIINSIDEADKVISCGGGNYYSNTVLGGDFILNLITIIYAGLKKKPVFMLPQSFGPFRVRFHFFLLRLGLLFSNKIFVRENVSYKLLRTIKIPKHKVEVLPDLALALDFHTQMKEEFTRSYGFKIGVTIIDRGEQYKKFNKQKMYIDELINTSKYLINKLNSSIYLFVQCYGPTIDQNDNLVTSEVFHKLKTYHNNVYLLNNFQKPEEIITQLSQMDLIIASRMHTAIFGLISYVPTLLIGYQPKAKGLFALFELNDFYISIDQIEPNIIKNKLEYLIDHRLKFVNQVDFYLPKIRQQIIERFKSLPW